MLLQFHRPEHSAIQHVEHFCEQEEDFRNK